MKRWAKLLNKWKNNNNYNLTGDWVNLFSAWRAEGITKINMLGCCLDLISFQAFLFCLVDLLLLHFFQLFSLLDLNFPVLEIILFLKVLASFRQCDNVLFFIWAGVPSSLNLGECVFAECRWKEFFGSYLCNFIIWDLLHRNVSLEFFVWNNKKGIAKNNKHVIFSAIIGQCSQAMKTHLQMNKDFQQWEDTFHVVSLLSEIHAITSFA